MRAINILVVAALRRDRWHIAIWAGGVFVAALVSAVSTAATYGGDAERVSALRLVIGNPAFLVSRGMPRGPGPGAFLFFQMGMVLAVMFAVFGVLFAVRHGRAEEDAGATELLRAAATGHVSGLAANLVAGAVAQAVLAVGLFGGFVLGGAEAAGSAWAGLALALVGVSFGAVGVLCGQLASTGRAAVAAGFGVVAVAYAVRAIADAVSVVDPVTLRAEPHLIAWFSALSLAEVMDPFGQIHVGALAVLVAVTAAVVAVTFRVEATRQFGASLIRQRPGRAHGAASLRTPLRLALRLQRGTLVLMSAAGLAVGAFAAALALLGSDAAQADPAIAATIRATVGEDGPIYDLLLAYTMLFVAEAAAIAGVLAILRARREEVGGNTETVRGTPVSPRRWMTPQITVAALSALAVVVTAWVGAAIVYLAWGASWGEVAGSVLAAALAQLPAAAVYIGLAGLLFAVLPRPAPAATWALLLAGVFIAEFGGRANLPDWLVATTPFTHTPLVTLPDADLASLLWMSAAALALTAAAIIRYPRRDLTP
jgi:ABC-2 type transport system permease protein